MHWDKGGITNGPTSPTSEGGEGGILEEPPEPTTPNSAFLPPHPRPNPARRRTKILGAGLLNALSYTLHGMMDADPETARRNGITKTRENISLVCLSIRVIFCITRLKINNSLKMQDLKYSSSTIQADLDRFQRQKVVDIREMAISMARSRVWCKKVSLSFFFWCFKGVESIEES